MARKPLVSISVVIWNGIEDTKQCLRSLKNITYQNVELIVTDNGSTDESVEYIKKRYPKVEILENGKNLGFVGGHNRAERKARGKYLLLLNNDTKVTKNFLSPLVKDLERDPKLAAVQSKVFLSRGRLDNVGSFLTPVGFLKHYGFKEKDNRRYQKQRQVFSPKAACLLIRMAVIDKIGLFDNDYFAYFEETDWAWRAYLAGYKVMFEPASIIYHNLGKTSTKLPYSLVNFHSFKNTLRTMLKNASGKTLCTMLPLFLIASSALSVSFLVQGKLSMFGSILKAQGWNLIHLPQTLVLRKKVQGKRVVSDKELFLFAMEPLDVRKSFRQYLQIRKNS